ncbi:MAG: L-seryl-tRNA(Sec) selenium transferase [Pyrinomonadaceae bacterium]
MKQKIPNKSKRISPMRFLPAIDALLSSPTAKQLSAEVGLNKLTVMARQTVEILRNELRQDLNGEFSKKSLLHKAETMLRQKFEATKLQRFQRVINATGVVIHTNLGRAPLSDASKQAVFKIASGYCTLEYDLGTGKRGRRGQQAEKLLCELTGAESALIVNNCAAATFLVLSAFGAGGEAIVSRGELVEIGGDFRVPDVMAQSGTRLVEVGTTNRTKVKDFADAITENTKLLVRVHPSNFRIVGFTAMPNILELAELARAQNILLYEDAGSGALNDLSGIGLMNEPVIEHSIKAGADVVTFSGDKLLGSVQAGIIVGRSEVVEKLRKHPLYRALRVSKMCYAALAATLESYQRGKQFDEIPVLQMLSQTKDEIRRRAENFIEKSQEFKFCNFKFGLLDGTSAVGGGSAPLAQLPTALISLESDKFSVVEIEEHLRSSSPPVIARVADNKVLLDLRTISTSEINEILLVLQQIESNQSTAI